MNIPFLDLPLQNTILKDEILQAWEEALCSAQFIGGTHVQKFEEEFAAASGIKHCVLVNSGTDALRFIFLGLGMQSGDEVITVANTFIATTEAISQAGGRVTFVDIDPNSYNIDPDLIEKAITTKTKGIVPVHLYGQMADMDSIINIAAKHNLWVVEDACQAHLATYRGKAAGTFGVAGAFSFYPGKNLGACGEGGAVTTDNADLAAYIRKLRDHGQAQKYYHDIEGYNGRCDAIQAAALRIKLKHLAEWNEKRRKNAALYKSLLEGTPGITLPHENPECAPVYHLFVIQLDNRELVAQYLKEHGIATALHYPVPLHMQKAYAQLQIPTGALPITEKVAKRILSLPMYAELTEEQIVYVCQTLKEAVCAERI